LHCNRIESIEKELDMNMKKEEEISKTTIEESFVIYDPDNPPYERLYLCKYLLELSDLEEEDNPKTG
jgi:hypothetical protein